MKIILMRHGNAVSGGSDGTRPLSEKGRYEAEAAGNFLLAIREIPDVIFHSKLFRSMETAQLVEDAIGKTGLLSLHHGIKPEDSALYFRSELLTEIFDKKDPNYSVMVVGHEPFMSTLASLLVLRSPVGLTFSTGTMLQAKCFNIERDWDFCFYVHSEYLLRLYS